MKEERFFYCPDAETTNVLPQAEADHAMRVLRLGVGDSIRLMDGKGNFYEATISEATKRECKYEITDKFPQESSWKGRLHLAVAPTKHSDRMEWLAEKATEIGVDVISFIDCQFSERKVMKCDRIERVVVSAVKQSHKAFMPEVREMCSFEKFIKNCNSGRRFIAHCYEEPELMPNGKPFLLDTLNDDAEEIVVMVGPEGDFSVKEVKMAIDAGFEPISLGRSRLRTETAALVAVHIMNINNRK